MILALDQASSCGWIVGPKAAPVACGLIDTNLRRFESQGMRYLKFEKALTGLLDTYKPTLVVMEEHRSHTGVQAAQVLGAYTATIMKLCEQREITYTAAPIASHKKAFTGTSRASKALTVAVARKKFPGLNITSEDIADAASIWWWATKQFS
jgi:Holliday junction resolvasome RuvABC endonuclease subunit